MADLELEAELRRRDEEDGHATVTEIWSGHLLLDKKGFPKPSLGNCITILSNADEWRGVLGYDERAEETHVLRSPPYFDAPSALRRAPRALIDADDAYTVHWLERRWGMTPTPQTVHAALNAVAGKNRFDRVRDYLESVEWDGVPRISTWLADYLGAEDDPYTRAVGRRWLVSAVARTFEPGCKADHVLVLEGRQGLMKSTALETVAGSEFFADDVPQMASKDAQQYLGGMWVIELGEMDAMLRTDSSTAKRFLVTKVDRYRPPYGKRPITHARRCVFCGTINPEEYLRDSTGGRRFWPVKCRGVIEDGADAHGRQLYRADIDGLAEARDQIWAEAVAAYRAGEPWYLDDPDVEALAREAQSQRIESDPWDDRIADYLAGVASFVTTSELLRAALQIEVGKQDKRAANRVGRIMRRLGWDYGTRRVNGIRSRGWSRPVAEAESPDDDAPDYDATEFVDFEDERGVER